MANKILIIAGSDSCGGAGLQADIRTATVLKTYSAAVVTCLTAQNSQRVDDIFYPPTDFIKKQIISVLDDMEIDVIKIGMLGNEEITSSVAKILKQKAQKIPIILDPIMLATSGDVLLKKSALKILKEQLISNCYLITPNIHEAEILADMAIKNITDVKLAAKKIISLGVKNVLITGGHLENNPSTISNYLLSEDGLEKLFKNKRLPFKNVRGTGCTLVSALACFLSKNYDLTMAVKKANYFVYKSIKNSQKIGLGSRILQHF